MPDEPTEDWAPPIGDPLLYAIPARPKGRAHPERWTEDD